MIAGTPSDRVVVIDTPDYFTFASEVNGVLQQDSRFEVAATYIDAYGWKAILVRQVDAEGVRNEKSR